MKLLEMLFGPKSPPLGYRSLGRNDPCWCGSGQKYKRCHLRADERHYAAKLRSTRCTSSG